MAEMKWLEEIEERTNRMKRMPGGDTMFIGHHLMEVEPLTKALRLAISALNQATIALSEETPMDTVMRVAAKAREALEKIERMGSNGDV